MPVIEHIATEIWLFIAASLEPRDLANLARASSKLNEVIWPILWRDVRISIPRPDSEDVPSTAEVFYPRPSPEDVPDTADYARIPDLAKEEPCYERVLRLLGSKSDLANCVRRLEIQVDDPSVDTWAQKRHFNALTGGMMSSDDNIDDTLY